MIRQAVILAAGKGKRMRENNKDPIIQSTPKPLLEIDGTTLIETKLRELAKNNVEVAIVVNPADEHLFREKLSEYDITYCKQAEPLGPGHAAYCAKDFVKDDLFLVLMGDDIYKYNLKEVLKSNEPTIYGYDVDDVSGYGAVITDSNGMVEKVIEKELSGKGTVNTGVWIMPREFFDVFERVPVEKNGEYYALPAIGILAERGIKFRLKKLDSWMGINTPDELERARAWYNKVKHHIKRGINFSKRILG